MRPASPHELRLDAPGGAGRHRSLWLEQALADEATTAGAAAGGEPLEGERRADVCVLGGGYVGLWTALRVRELAPDARVVVLEADVCGAGASGANGGFLLSWWPKIATLLARVPDREEAYRLARASAAAIDEIAAFCAARELDVELRRGGWLWTATAPAQLGAWRQAVALGRARGDDPFTELSAEELAQRTGSRAHLGGVLQADAATVQPARLVRALRALALREGIELHEHSPVRSIDAVRGLARAPGGTIEAPAIVLATNAWAAGIGPLRGTIVPLSSDVVATAPIGDALAASGWSGGEAISDSRLRVNYWRTTADGRVVFGKGGGALAYDGRVGTRFDHDAARTREVAAELRRLVPAAAGAPLAAAWGGAVDRSLDGLPFFGALPAVGAGERGSAGREAGGDVRIVYGLGFSGNGVAPSFLAGRILASLALGRRDEWSRCGLASGPPGRFPPEPIRYLGGRLVRAAVVRQERREDADLPVGRATRALAGLAPPGFSKAGR
jgi:glycine/D-amino acid oxidase-like deaminating enzyme